MTYNEEYFKDRTFKNKYYYMATEWAEQLKPSTVFDYGAGQGFLTHAFNYIGINCTGYEPNLDVIKTVHELAKNRVSASVPNDTFDLVVCMDVMEHVPKELERPVINDLISLTKKYLLLSICDTTLSKKYVDETHINIRPRKYWEHQFTKRGLTQLPIPNEWLFNEQLYLFKKEEVIK